MKALRILAVLLSLAGLVSGCIRLQDEPKPWPCHTSDDCHSGEACLADMTGRQLCYPAGYCEYDSQCEPTEHCVGAKCEPRECTSGDESACDGFHCIFSMCLRDCTSDVGCAAGYWCLEHACKEALEVGDVCQRGSQCGTGNCCAGAPGEEKTCEETACELVPQGGKCSSDDMCVTKTCRDAKCVSCTGADCVTKGTCLNRQCGVDQGTDCGSCGGKQYCSDDGKCVDACVGLQCGEDHGVLCPGCSKGMFCGAEQQCQVMKTCLPGTYIASPGSIDSDKVCEPCADGHYANFEDTPQCEPFVDCPGIADNPGNVSSPRVCYDGYADIEGSAKRAETSIALAVIPSQGAVVGGRRDMHDNRQLGDLDEVAYLRMYDDELGGEVQWEITSGTSGLNRVMDVAYDGSTYVYAAGFGYSDNGAGYVGGGDAWVKKVQLDTGAVIWTHALATPAYDAAWSLALAPDGNVVVAGSTAGSLGGARVATGTNTDFFVFKLSKTNGSPIWKTQFGPGSATGLGVDGSGDVLVAGFGPLTSVVNPQSPSSRLALVKLWGVDGSELWSKLRGSSASDVPQDLVVDAKGDAYVKVYSPGNASFVVKVAGGTGSGLWAHDVVPELAAELKSGLAITPKNTLLVTGTAAGDVDGEGVNWGSYIAEVDPTFGTHVWLEQFGGQHDATLDLGTDAAGSIYLCGSVDVELNDPPNGQRQTSSLLAKIVR